MSFVEEADDEADGVDGGDQTDAHIVRGEFSQVDDQEAAATPGDRGKINKSAEIRSAARRLIESGSHPRPVEIVRILEERGIAVAPAMVSIVLKKMGVQGRSRRSKSSKSLARPPARPPLPPVPERPLAAAPKAAASTSGSAFTLEQLIAAKAFVDEVGSPRQAMALLEALDRLLE
jgi:hypothetical protein